MNFRPLILQLMLATMLMVTKINLASQPLPKSPTRCKSPPNFTANYYSDAYSVFIICSPNDNTTNPFVKFRESNFIRRSPPTHFDGYVRTSAYVALICYNKWGSVNGSILEIFSSVLQNLDILFQLQQNKIASGDTEIDGFLKPERRKISFKRIDQAKISLKPNGRAKISTFLHIALIGLIFPTIGISWIFWRSKKKKIARLRQNLFVKNGGLILEKMILRRKRCLVFTAEDLSKATNNYSESRVLHKDSNEPVYKGTLLEDGVNKLVTIKRGEKIDPIQIQDFISKLVNFSWIDHMNVVKLIGCCLETQVPLLVYEYYTDKTLYDSIHDKFSFLSWEHRLKIATETARSLLYLHSGGKTPIIHGNIKSSNILLDRGFVVKIAFPSFTGLLGTDGKKSDVYSFGVILAELLTGDEVLNFDRPRGEEFLAVYFISALKGDRMLEILEHDLLVDVNIEQLKEVSILTEMCLRERCEERPTMIEVLMKLENVVKESGARQRLSNV
ncbi:Serine threonine kinase [Olea europaea subsp. europaea]|uniref:Serine threonine kinase n=1 Tax=Olea europaea subsp. europaea TaxID=158383 RepID=A0A8S0QB95_OLEEU|nr:Serine threonine kinase [Olea europaea subsp. europaea]